MSGVRVNKVPFLVIITLLFSSLSPLIQVASATGQGTITIFSNGIPTSTINLNGSLVNSSVSVTLERNTTIEHATFEISYDYALNSPSPVEVILDIGSDGQYEWAWNTLGYGDFGRQTTFSMGANNSSATVNSAGNIIPVRIKTVPDTKPSIVPNLSAFDCLMYLFSPKFYLVHYADVA